MLIESKKTRYKQQDAEDPASKMTKEIKLMKTRMKPDKNEIYKNFGKEKSVTHNNTIVSSEDIDVRLRKTKIGVKSHLNEETVQEFMNIIHKQNQDKAEKRLKYMQRSLYKPNPATLPGLPRRWSPTRPRTQVA